ncbi:MAG: hypothetical protein JJU02_08265 [Cryomorphaceae bacterium]|nr:hypothetical protein [Cryomorphaceae bacterium]
MAGEIFRLLNDWEQSSKISFFSSGSTGNPRQIDFSPQQIKASALRTLKMLDIKKEGTAALVLPLQFTGGKMVVFRAFIFKMKLFVYESSIHFSKAFKPVDFISVSPAQLSANKDVLIKCHTVLVGGGATSKLLENEKWPNRVYHTFGMTETLSHVALRRLGVENWFTAVEGVRFSTDEQNKLHITDEVLDIYQLPTNDRVELQGENQFQWLGRADAVINSGGVKIQIVDWEEKWKKMTDIQIKLVGMPDVQFGEKPVLLVKGDPDQNEIRKLVEFFPRHHRPNFFYTVSDWPQTSSGKSKLFLYPEDISELAATIIFEK